jgi:hypothetical protein
VPVTSWWARRWQGETPCSGAGRRPALAASARTARFAWVRPHAERPNERRTHRVRPGVRAGPVLRQEQQTPACQSRARRRRSRRVATANRSATMRTWPPARWMLKSSISDVSFSLANTMWESPHVDEVRAVEGRHHLAHAAEGRRQRCPVTRVRAFAVHIDTQRDLDSRLAAALARLDRRPDQPAIVPMILVEMQAAVEVVAPREPVAAPADRRAHRCPGVDPRAGGMSSPRSRCGSRRSR